MADSEKTLLPYREGQELLVKAKFKYFNESIQEAVLSIGADDCQQKVFVPIEKLSEIVQSEGAPRSEIPTPTLRANTQIEGTRPSTPTSATESEGPTLNIRFAVTEREFLALAACLDEEWEILKDAGNREFAAKYVDGIRSLYAKVRRTLTDLKSAGVNNAR